MLVSNQQFERRIYLINLQDKQRKHIEKLLQNNFSITDLEQIILKPFALFYTFLSFGIEEIDSFVTGLLSKFFDDVDQLGFNYLFIGQNLFAYLQENVFYKLAKKIQQYPQEIATLFFERLDKDYIKSSIQKLRHNLWTIKIVPLFSQGKQEEAKKYENIYKAVMSFDSKLEIFTYEEFTKKELEKSLEQKTNKKEKVKKANNFLCHFGYTKEYIQELWNKDK